MEHPKDRTKVGRRPHAEPDAVEAVLWALDLLGIVGRLDGEAFTPEPEGYAGVADDEHAAGRPVAVAAHAPCERLQLRGRHGRIIHTPLVPSPLVRPEMRVRSGRTAHS